MDTHTVKNVVLVRSSQEIAEVVQSAEPGLMIRIAPGVYREAICIDRGGEPGNPLRIEAEQAGTVVLNGAERLQGWKKDGEGRFRRDFEVSAQENLRAHFGPLPTPCQVWVADQRLALVGGVDRLTENSFALEDGQLWLQLPPGVDPNTCEVEVARHGQMLRVPASHVEFSGLVVTRCASSVQIGGAEFSGSHVLIEDCEFSEGAGGIGAHFDASDSIIRGCHIHHNGQMGFALVASRVLFENNLVEHNDLRGFIGHPEAEWHVWECGGGKVAYASDCVFRGNRFLNNVGGPGLWLDIDNFRNRIEGNYFSNNGHSSIMIEISRDNLICNNIICDSHESNYASTAILVQLSNRTRIYHNLILRSEGYGVHLRWHLRSRDIHPFDPADPDEFEQVHGFRQEDWMGPDEQYPTSENDVRNNLFINCRRGAIWIDPKPECVKDNTSDYNFFWNEHNLHPMAGGHRVCDWHAMTGLDAHSFYDKMLQFGPLLTDDTMEGVSYDPAGPLPGFKVPRIEAAPTDIRGCAHPEQTLAGPLAPEV